MPDSVASVTITYNGKNLLAKHMRALLSQTRPLDEIVIVDNGSSDGTSEYLAQEFPQVKVLRLDVNVGAAGAWEAGIKYAAFERGHTWIWSFDDDSEPAKRALELLLFGGGGAASDSSIGVLAPVPVHPASGLKYKPLLTTPQGIRQPTDEMMNQAVLFVDMVITSGCLIRGEVARKIGLPIGGFYMDYFDYEYVYRARRAGYQVAMISECTMAHKVGSTRTVTVFGSRRMWIQQPPWREYYIGRNLIYMVWHLNRSIIMLKFAFQVLSRHAVMTVLVGENRFASLLKTGQGICDGFRGKLGIRFRPKQYGR